jgi:hypothetical protein
MTLELTQVQKLILEVILSGYVGTLCIICRKPITKEDMQECIWAGVQADGNCIAHKECWDNKDK